MLAGVNNGGTAAGLGGGSTATFFGLEDLWDLKLSRAAPYRATGAWVMSNGAIKKARKWVDLQGRYLWQPSIAAGQPDLFDGNPVYESPELAAPGSATKSVVYGDGLAGLLIKSSRLRVAISDSFKFDTDQIAIRTVQRLGLVVQDPAAMAYLVSKNT